MVIDEELFKCQDAFEYLVGDPINQLGRDLKKKAKEQEVTKTSTKYSCYKKRFKAPVKMHSLMKYFTSKDTQSLKSKDLQWKTSVDSHSSTSKQPQP